MMWQFGPGGGSGGPTAWADITGKPTTFTPSVHSHTASDVTDFNAAVAALITGKQDTLVSATNIKTINGNSLLGSGDLAISGGSGSPGGSTGELQYNNAGAFAGAADIEVETGQLRLPAIADPAAPAANGIKLFNLRKTGQRDSLAVKYPNGRTSRLSEHPHGILSYKFQPGVGVSTLVGDGSMPQSIVGTATASAPTLGSLRLILSRMEARATTAATTAVAGFRGATTFFRVGKTAGSPGGFNFKCVFSTSSYSLPATLRLICGVLNSTAAPTDIQPSSQINGIWLGADAGDTNLQIMHNDGTGTATKIDLGASFPKPVGNTFIVYSLELFSPNSTTQSVEYRVVRYNEFDLVVEAEATGTITTDLPSNITMLANRLVASVGGTSSQVGIAMHGVYVDLDY